MSANQVALWYLIASICFIFALKGLSHPTTARRGNLMGIVGMPKLGLAVLRNAVRGYVFREQTLEQVLAAAFERKQRA